ncbi:MAG TPA: transglycosylase SLT domain-containing protein [Gemmatimonadaceae bacterium]|nr:transglycosylase SLT domain-containing protein [Gemmatimonadaceae bacterium]
MLATGALGILLLTAARVHPLFARRAPVVQQILRHAYVDSTTMRAPWLVSPAELAITTPQFLADRERFARDLLRTGKVTETRAWRLADVAVKESYRRRVPPALVLGVMLTENDELKSSARSHVGAVGLMQVLGRHWRDALGPKFGTDLRNDTTNLRYGIFILSYMARRVAAEASDSADAQPGAAVPDSSWRKMLLGYNGCVQGRNTRDCHAYPSTVQRNVVSKARTTCAGRDFYDCVAKPLWLAMRADAEPQ